MEIIRKKRTRINAVKINERDYAKLGANPARKPKIYIRSLHPNRMKAVMVAASFASMISFFEQGGYDYMGAKWCSEVWQISRFYQIENSSTRA